MTKFLNAILILILLIAGGRLLMRGHEYRTLVQERNQLIEKLDGFRVSDSSKYLVQTVDTGDPMLFMWRVHKPGGVETGYFGSFAYSESPIFGTRGNAESKFERVSARFEFVGDELYFDTQTASGGHRSLVGAPELVGVCKQHWGDLEIEVLGQDGAIEIDVDEEVVLLQIAVPDELLIELEAKLGKNLARRFSDKLFCRFSFGERGVIEGSRQQSQAGSQ